MYYFYQFFDVALAVKNEIMSSVQYLIVSNETTQMYVCMLEEFILVVNTLLYNLELKICIGIVTGLYTMATIEAKG